MEADLFCRQSAMPGHDQSRLEAAKFGVIGAGGLGSWIALGLARMGARDLTIIEPDSFDRSNAPRQFMFGEDLFRPKAHVLSKNLIPHFTNAARVRGIASAFDDDVVGVNLGLDALIVGVDNNEARLAASAYGLRNAVPIVFVMHSRDGLRVQAFLQRVGGPCLSCVLPNLDPLTFAPCATVSIAGCFLAAGHAVALAAAVVMGQDRLPIWRETSLDGSTERTGTPLRVPTCRMCSSDRKLSETTVALPLGL